MRISIVMEALTGKFDTDTARTARLADRRSKEIQRSMTRMAKAIGAAIAAAATAFGAMIKGSVDAADRLSKLSQSTGISTESLSQLQHAANITGSSLDEIAKGMNRLSRNAVDASRGLAAPKRAFDALGVSTQNADGSMRDTEDLMLDIADRFAGIEDGAAKAALAQELFGRAGADMIPFLNQGRAGIEALKNEADQLGLTLDSRAGRAAEQFNDNLTRLKSAGQGLVNQAVQELLPMLSAMSHRMVQSAKNGGFLEVAIKALANSFRVIVSAGVIVTSIFEQLGRVIYGVGAAVIRIAQGEFKLAAGEIKDAFSDATNNVTNDMETIARIWSDTVPEIEQSANRLQEALTFDDGSMEKAAAAQQKAAESALSQIQKLEAGLRQQVDTYGASEAAVIAYRIAHGDLAEAFNEAGAAADPYRERLVALTAEYARLEEETKAAQKAADDFKKSQDEIAAIVDATRTPLERYEATIRRLNELKDVKGGALDPETYRRASEAAQDAFDKATKAADGFAKEFREGVFRSLGDGIYTAMTDGAKSGWKGFYEAGIDTINRLVAQALAKQLATGLFGGEQGGAGQWGWASAIGGFFGGGRATGGPVSAGMTYRVNEREPEFFRPNVGGEVVPLSKMPAQDGVRVTQNIMVQGRVDTRTAQQLQIEAARRQRVSSARLG